MRAYWHQCEALLGVRDADFIHGCDAVDLARNGDTFSMTPAVLSPGGYGAWGGRQPVPVEIGAADLGALCEEGFDRGGWMTPPRAPPTIPDPERPARSRQETPLAKNGGEAALGGRNPGPDITKKIRRGWRATTLRRRLPRTSVQHPVQSPWRLQLWPDRSHPFSRPEAKGSWAPAVVQPSVRCPPEDAPDTLLPRQLRL